MHYHMHCLMHKRLNAMKIKCVISKSKSIHKSAQHCGLTRHDKTTIMLKEKVRSTTTLVVIMSSLLKEKCTQMPFNII
jgi:hypothetical protein